MLYAKVLNPAVHGKKVYANNGSARRATNYLEQEARQGGAPGAEFFGREADGKLSADQVVEMLDNNHKGLGKDAVKFHSLVLSPDQDQLALLGNDPQQLHAFTRAAMQRYAANFNLKNGREQGEPDLVWAATIHTERKNRGTDEGGQGQQKAGLQTHVHVLVSARDREQKITLNPLGAADRFNRVHFQAAVGVEMDVRVGTAHVREGAAGRADRRSLEQERGQEIQSRARSQGSKELTPQQIARKLERLDGQVARVNSKLIAGQQLDPAQVKDVARERKFDDVFYKTLGRIERNAEAGKITLEPYEYLRTCRRQQGRQLTDWQPRPTPPPVARVVREILDRQQQRPRPSAIAAIEQRVHALAAALNPTTKTQDMRSEEERQRERTVDRGIEM